MPKTTTVLPMPDLAIVDKLTKDVKDTAKLLTEAQARFFVDNYYSMQDYRIASAGQARSAAKIEEPIALVSWLSDQMERVEDQIKKLLLVFAESRPEGRWLLQQHGIGPVLSAGLLAHVDVAKCETASGLWRYAGFDPTCKWEKKTKRPWNAKLKVLCWKIGQSFMKFHNSDDCFYGKIYKARKEYEINRNESGAMAETAARLLTEKKFGKDTEAFKHLSSGKLPPAQIDARARRYAVKMFLVHYYRVAYYAKFGKPAPSKCYIIDADNAHTHWVACPHWPEDWAPEGA